MSEQSDHGSAKAVERRYVAAMGPRLGILYYRLWNECVWLHGKWSEFVVVFGSNPARVQLLNEAAGGFFRIVQDSLWESVLLHICRLTDPPRSGGRDNLTVRCLPSIVAPSLRSEVEGLLVLVLQKAAFARDWRNRRISHQDLRLALRESATPLASANRRSVKQAIDAIAAVLNALEGHYCDATVGYDMFSVPGNGEAMLQALKNGFDAEAERWKRIKAGRALPGDHKRRPAV